MKKRYFFPLLAVTGMYIWCVSCSRESKSDQYRAEKHERDSAALAEQVRSLDYYQLELDRLQPQADSLIALFKYEKNDKYQDHGTYVVTARGSGMRVMVSDDGQQISAYRNGHRVDMSRERFSASESEAIERARHLAIVISDIRELEKRIGKTSLEIQKYQKRLQKH